MSTQQYVKWFRSASPYINAHRGRTFVLLLSGDAVAHPNIDNIVQDIALLNSLGVKLVIVHGAAPQIDAALASAGLNSQRVNGLRVSTTTLIRTVAAAITLVRVNLEALLARSLLPSELAGKTGSQRAMKIASGNYLTAKPVGIVDGTDFEHTGAIRRVDAKRINAQLDLGDVVLLSPLAYSPSGELFNLSAAEMAAQVASELEADKLILFGSDTGLRDTKGELLRELELFDAKALLAKDDSVEQRLLKVAINACSQHVRRTHVISYAEDGALLEEMFSRDGQGTLISFEPFEQLRVATIDDIHAILQLIQPLEADGTLVTRSREKLESEIARFTIIERDGAVIACAALYPYNQQDAQQRSAEVACVVVHPDYRNSGRAAKLLACLDSIAARQGLDKLFVLTTKTAHWFLEQGFTEAPQEQLPAEKLGAYNVQRNSKVFVREIKA